MQKYKKFQVNERDKKPVLFTTPLPNKDLAELGDLTLKHRQLKKDEALQKRMTCLSKDQERFLVLK